MNINAFFEELSKIARTRAAKEVTRALTNNDLGTAEHIGQGYNQLGLAPRQVKSLGGGMEAHSDVMMGPTPHGQSPGLFVNKTYKPDSPIATGQNMTALLGQKKQLTDTARAMSPAAKAMLPEMYGYKEHQGPGGQLRHTSAHEYVHGGKSMRSSANPVAHAQRIQDTVVKPLEAQTGTHIRDIARPHIDEAGQKVLGGNSSNVLMTPKGPKVVDFLPHQFGSSTPGQGGMVLQRGKSDLVGSNVGSGRLDTGYGDHNVGQLKRDVHRPQANYQMPALPAQPGEFSTVPAKPRTPSPTQGSTIATNVEGRARASLAPTVRPPAPAGLRTAVTNPVNPALAKTMPSLPMPAPKLPSMKPPMPALGGAAKAMRPGAGLGKIVGGFLNKVV